MHACKSVMEWVRGWLGNPALRVGLLLALMPHASWPEEISVVATTTDVGAVLGAVGGDRIDLRILATGSMDPHYLEAKPSYMTSMRKARLLAYNGLQLEIGWLPLLIEGARNRDIVAGAPGHLSMNADIEILEVPEGPLSRAQGDIHPEGNPHYTLDPRNLVIMAQTAEAALSRIDPEGAPLYARNRAEFVERLQEAIVRWEGRLQPYRGTEIVCFHKQWEYLLRWLGIEIVDYVENKPGISPSPRHIVALEQTILQHRVGVILASTFVGSDHLRRLVERTGTRLVVLPAAVSAEEGVDDPLALFDRITLGLQNAFKEISDR